MRRLSQSTCTCKSTAPRSIVVNNYQIQISPVMWWKSEYANPDFFSGMGFRGIIKFCLQGRGPRLKFVFTICEFHISKVLIVNPDPSSRIQRRIKRHCRCNEEYWPGWKLSRARNFVDMELISIPLWDKIRWRRTEY